MRNDPSGNEQVQAALAHLCEMRAFEREHLPFVRTLEDRDLICAIGRHQLEGRPLGMKQVFLLGLGSVATMQRRLRHLRRHGAILHKPCNHDRRAVEVLLSPKLLNAIASGLSARRG